MKYAAIDIGTNSIKFSLFNSRLQLMHRELDYIRLGDDMHHLQLSTERRQKAFRIIKKMINSAQRRHIEKIIIIGTSALRNFQNGKEFAEEIRQTLHIPFQILHGKKEAQLTFSGASHHLQKTLQNKHAVFLDIGAGSSEIIMVREGEMTSCKSIETGALGIKNNFTPPYSSEDILPALQKTISTQKKNIPGTSQLLVGIGGSFTTAARILLRQKIFHAPTLCRTFFQPQLFFDLEKDLRGISATRLQKQYSLHARRADLVHAGIALINAFLILIKPEKIRISTEGVGKGAVIKYLM